MSDRGTALVLGILEDELSRRIASGLLEKGFRVWVIAKERSRANRFRDSLPNAIRSGLQILEGDESAIDFGLSGREYAMLLREITHVHHPGTARVPGTPPHVAERANVDITRELVEFAEAAAENGRPLDHCVLWSTLRVSGRKSGRFTESELPAESFLDPSEGAMARSEAMIREIETPWTILRLPYLTGDSRTGEVVHGGKLQGPYLFVRAMLSAPPDVRVPIPIASELEINSLPIDYVSSAGLTLALDPRSRGKTLHLIDPRAPTVRRFFDLLAEELARPIPRAYVPTLGSTLMRAPGVDRIVRAGGAFLKQLETDVTYDEREARALLEDAGIETPRIDDYVGAMIDTTRAWRQKSQDTLGFEASDV